MPKETQTVSIPKEELSKVNYKSPPETQEAFFLRIEGEGRDATLEEFVQFHPKWTVEEATILISDRNKKQERLQTGNMIDKFPVRNEMDRLRNLPEPYFKRLHHGIKTRFQLLAKIMDQGRNEEWENGERENLVFVRETVLSARLKRARRKKVA